MDSSVGIELRKVFVSSFHGLEKIRKSSAPMQAERSPNRRNSKDPLDFLRNPDRCGVLSVSEPDFGPVNPRCENFPITLSPFLTICGMDMPHIEMQHFDRLFPFQASRFSFCGIRKSPPNKIRSHVDGFRKRRIPGAMRNSIPF
jgi:hypothetical protein